MTGRKISPAKLAVREYILDHLCHSAEANRIASRRLYALAREAGWHKLTLREQQRWGLDGQWHREEEIATARAKRGHPTGTGEHTLLASSLSSHIAEWADGRR